MSKSKKVSKTVADVNWDEGLINAVVEDDCWSPYLGFLVPDSSSVEPHLQVLAAAADGGNRRKFTVIDMESMLQSARDDMKLASTTVTGGGGRKSKQTAAAPASKPQHIEVCEHVVNAMSTGGEVPAQLTARMLKYTILRKRMVDIAKREALRKEADEASKPQKAATDKGAKKAASGRTSKAGKKGKETPATEATPEIPIPQKLVTTMRKRGEEDLDSKYIDDEPADGPSCYFLLTGFTSAKFFQELSSVKLKAHALVKVMGQGICASQDAQSEEEQAALQQKTSLLSHFWSTITSVIKDTPSGSMLRDLAQLELPVVMANVPSSDDAKRNYGQTLFDSVSQLLYSVLNLYKQYLHYLDYLNLQSFPEGGRSDDTEAEVSSDAQQSVKNDQLRDSSVLVDMRYYNMLLSVVPEECTSVPLILNCMLEQVSVSLSTTDASSDPQNSTNTVHPSVVSEFGTCIAALALPSSKQMDLLADQCTTEEVSDTTDTCIPIAHGDLIKERTFHLKNSKHMNIPESETNINQLSNLMAVVNAPSIPAEESCKASALLHSVEHFCVSSDLSPQMLNYALIVLSLESVTLPNASTPPLRLSWFGAGQSSHLLFDHPFSIPLKELSSSTAGEAIVPYSKSGEYGHHSQIPSNEQANASAPETCEVDQHSATRFTLALPRPLTDLRGYSTCEYLQKDALLQMLQESVHYTHPYVIPYYHKHSSSVVVVAHTGFDGNPIHKYGWSSQAHAKVGFQNYLQYVTKKFGDAVDQAVLEDTESREQHERERKVMIEEEMKALQEQQGDMPDKKEEEMTSAKGTKGNAKKTPGEKSPQGKRSKMSTKECTPTASTHDIVCVEASLSEFEKQKRFIAYDMGDKVLLNNGSITTQFTGDGAQICTEKYQLGESHVSVKVSVLSNGNTISTYLTQRGPNDITVPNRGENIVPESAGSSDKASGREDNSEQENAAHSPPPAMIPEPPHSVAFASLQASFHNSLTVSVSHYGPKGNGKLPYKPTQPKILNEVIRPESTSDSRPQSRQGTSPQKLSKKQLEQQQQLLEQERLLEGQKAEKRKAAMEKYLQQCNDLGRQNKYQQMFLSTPYGLQVHSQVMIDLQADPALTDGSDGYIVIRQSYPVKSSGTQSCEQFLQSAYQEKHRSYLPDGSVARFMLDKSVIIQCSDGSVYRTANSSEFDQYTKSLPSSEQVGKVPEATSHIPERITSAAKVSFVDGVEGNNGCKLEQAVWVVTMPSGQQYLWNSPVSAEPNEPETHAGDVVKTETREGELAENVEASGDVQDKSKETEKIIPLKLLETFSSTDPLTKEVLISREDNVTLLHRPSGSLVVEHADGTRFTTVFKRGSSVPTEIIIECPGFARVVQMPVSCQCKLEFVDSTAVICSTDGSYTLSKPNAYKLDISRDGKAQYKPDITILKGAYTLNYTGQGELLVALDQLSNTFSVDAQGEASTTATEIPSHQAFTPRYFVLDEDGSYELLHNDSVKNIISKAEMDPKAVVLKQQEPNCDNFTTIIEPCVTNLPIIPYMEEDIVPSNLRKNAKGDALQQTSSPCKQNGSNRFGVAVGKALVIGSYEKQPPPKQFASPNALKYRQFVHLRLVEGSTKEQIFTGLTDFLIWSRKRESDADALMPGDSRKGDEIAIARALQSKWNVPTEATVVANYTMAASSNKSEKEEKPPAQTRKQVNFAVTVKAELEEMEAVQQALRNNEVPSYFQSEEYFSVQLPDMDALAAELAQPKKTSPSQPVSTTADEQQDSKYTHSGVSTPSTLHSASVTMIAEREVVSPAQSELGPVSSLSKLRPSNPTPDHAHGKGTPTEVRPTNPTPSHALKTSGDQGPSASSNSEGIQNPLIGSDITQNSAEPLTSSEGLPQVQAPLDPSGKQASSLSCIVALPKNETTLNLQHTYKSQGRVSDVSQSPEGGGGEQSSIKTSIFLDVTGNPRKSPVTLPVSVQGGRPGERSNTKFLTVEEPVRRKVHTSSIATAVVLRGFEVLPDEIEFGILKEGCTYGYTVTLRNTGVDSCRFKIKQPPPSTGIKVIYTPGPVAAGMSRTFEVEIFAMAVGAVGDCGVGLVQHNLEITSETSILFMPIKATVLTCAAYHNRLPTHPQGQEAAGVKILTTRPSSRNSITRPPKTQTL